MTIIGTGVLSKVAVELRVAVSWFFDFQFLGCYP